MGKHPECPDKVAKLLKTQKGKCTHCNSYFTNEANNCYIDIATFAQRARRALLKLSLDGSYQQKKDVPKVKGHS